MGFIIQITRDIGIKSVKKPKMAMNTSSRKYFAGDSPFTTHQKKAQRPVKIPEPTIELLMQSRIKNFAEYRFFSTPIFLNLAQAQRFSACITQIEW